MTVANQTKKVTALGNGVTTVFSFSPMVLPDDSDQLVVTKVSSAGVETVLTEGTGTANYSVSVSSYPGTGSITYPASGTANILATGESVVMKRVLTLEQQTDLENQGGYFPDVQETQFDRLVMIDLQQQDEIERAPKFVVGADLSGFDNEMAAPVASKMPVVNSAGTGWEWVDTPTAAVIAAAAAQAAAEAAQAAAEQAETNAETAETNAETAETNAEASAVAAANSAAAAAAAAGSNLFNTIADKSADYTIVADTDDGTLFQVDSSGGNVALTLPSIAVALEGERYGILRTSASNTVTLVRNGTDTINGVAGSYTITAAAGEFVIVVADDATPDNWVVIVWAQATADEVTLTKSGNVLSVKNNGVPLAKLAAASAASRLLGRRSGSTGNYEEITLGSGLSMSAGGELSATGTSPFSASYDSGDLSMTAATVHTLTHGLGAKPKLVMLWLACRTAEASFVAGDEVLYNPIADGDAARGVSIHIPNGSTTGLVATISSNIQTLLRDDNGVNFSITPGSWKLIVRAYA